MPIKKGHQRIYCVSESTIVTELGNLTENRGGYFRIYSHVSKNNLTILINQMDHDINLTRVSALCNWQQFCIFLNMEIETLQTEYNEEDMGNLNGTSIFQQAILNVLAENELEEQEYT